MQEKILSGWKNNPPDYVYWQEPSEGKWYDLASYQPKLITEWVKNNYEMQGNLGDNVQIWQRK